VLRAASLLVEIPVRLSETESRNRRFHTDHSPTLLSSPDNAVHIKSGFPHRVHRIQKPFGQRRQDGHTKRRLTFGAALNPFCFVRISNPMSGSDGKVADPQQKSLSGVAPGEPPINFLTVVVERTLGIGPLANRGQLAGRGDWLVEAGDGLRRRESRESARGWRAMADDSAIRLEKSSREISSRSLARADCAANRF
jgi:hypothetical protein